MTAPSITLPPYILEQIFTYLDFTYAFELSLVCREFSDFVVTSSTLWRSWWTTHPWLRRDFEIPTSVLDGSRGKKNGKEKGKEKATVAENESGKENEDGEEKRKSSDRESDETRDWHVCCRRRYEYELEQVDCTSDVCWIALQGNATAIRKLVSIGTSIHFDARSKTTPLHCAAERGNLRAMRALIALGADVNASRDIAPLHIAARYGRMHAIELLIAHGARLDCKTARSSMPLHYAAIAGDNVIEYLVRVGSCVNSRDQHDDTPLHEAAESGNLRAARELVRLGADVNAVNEIGCTPLHFAAEKPAGLVLELVRELVAMGALVDAEDDLGLTPYHLAVWRGQDEVADELSRMGAKRTKPPEGALYAKCMQPGEFVYSPGHGYVKKNNTTSDI